MTDVFGDIIDAEIVESYVSATLKAWLPAQLAHQQRRRGLPKPLPAPRSWPTMSDFDPEPQEQLPAIFIVSPGTAGQAQHDRGVYRVTWRFDVGVMIAGKDEREARFLAALYLAAIKGALIQNRTLGGHVETTVWTGPDAHAFGITEKTRSARAIYGTAFEVTVRNAVNARLGPAEPPPDPQNPGSVPPPLNTAEIVVTATRPEDIP